MKKTVALTPVLQRRVAAESHWLALEALSRVTALGLDSLVFQGGTSLALAWSSPRFSEDLDFLLSQEASKDIERIMAGVGRHVEKGLQLEWPGAKVQVKPRIHEDNPNALFRLGISLPNIMGNVMVKVEFWRVPAKDMVPYLKTHTPLQKAAKTATIAGVARPEQILVDKIIALAHRDRLKWRDLFDMWFLLSQNEAAKLMLNQPERLRESLAKAGILYNKTTDETAEGLKRFLETPLTELTARAEQGLKPWLSTDLWQQLWPHTVREMAQVTLQAAKTGLESLQSIPDSTVTRTASKSMP